MEVAGAWALEGGAGLGVRAGDRAAVAPLRAGTRRRPHGQSPPLARARTHQNATLQQPLGISTDLATLSILFVCFCLDMSLICDAFCDYLLTEAAVANLQLLCLQEINESCRVFRL